MSIITDKQLVSLHIKSDQVKVQFTNEVTFPVDESDEESEEVDNEKAKNVYTVTSKQKPHIDLLTLLKSLRNMALELVEIEVNSKDIGTWGVIGFKIAGDVTFKTSRVVLFLTKEVKRTSKIIEIKTPQTVMYPEKDETLRYHQAEKMSQIIESVIEEVWLYLNGKSEDEQQLPLFPHEPKLQTNFTQ